MKHILIVGKKFSGTVKYLEEHGYDYTVLKDIKTTKFKDKKFKHRVLCDFANEKTIIEALKQLNVRPDAVFSTYEAYVAPAALIAEYLGLPGMPREAAEACTDKELMRQKFAQAPKQISPDFAEVHDWEGVEAFAAKHQFPLIMKPANLSKSLLVTKSADINELRMNFERSMAAIDETYHKYAPDATPKLLIEEFLEGRVYSVDAFVDAAGVPHVMREIVDYQTGYEVGYDDNFHYSRILPSKLTAAEQAALRECAELGCRALGMKSSPAHIEVIMTGMGPRIVEIGARNGGYRERMYGLANGIDIAGNALRIALGEQPELTAQKNEPVAVLELFPKESGEFIELQNEEKLRELPSLEYLSIKVKPGECIGKSSDGYKAAAIIILHHSDPKQFERDLDFVNKEVRVRV